MQKISRKLYLQCVILQGSVSKTAAGCVVLVAMPAYLFWQVGMFETIPNSNWQLQVIEL